MVFEVACEQALEGIEAQLTQLEDLVRSSPPADPHSREVRSALRNEFQRVAVNQMDADERNAELSRLKHAVDVIRIALDTARRVREQIDKAPSDLKGLFEFRKILSELPMAALETWPVLTTREDVEAFTLFRELWIRRLERPDRDLLLHWLRHRKEKLVLHGVEGKGVAVELM